MLTGGKYADGGKEKIARDYSRFGHTKVIIVIEHIGLERTGAMDNEYRNKIITIFI